MRKRFKFFIGMRKEFMQRGGSSLIVTGRPFVALNMPLKSAFLHREEFGKCCLSSLCIIRKYHLSNCDYPFRLKEHMLCPAKPDSLRPEISCYCCIMRRVCVCPNPDFLNPSAHFMNMPKSPVTSGVISGALAENDFSCCAVKREIVSLFDVECVNCEISLALVYVYCAAACNAAFAHSLATTAACDVIPPCR